MTRWSYVLQRGTTKTILTRDAAMRRSRRDGMSWSLSAPGTATFVSEPHLMEQPAADGLPMFVRYNTILTALADGVPMWRGLLVSPTYEGKTRTLVFDSLTAYPSGIAYTGDPYYGEQADPADIMRMLWDHVQGYQVPVGDVGVVVIGSTSLRIGTFSTQKKKDTAAAYDKAVASWHAAVAERNRLQQLENTTRTDYSKAVAALSAAIAVRVDRNSALTARKKTLTAANSALAAAKRTKDPGKIAAAQTAVTNAQSAVNAASAAVDAAKAVVVQRTAARDAQRKVVDTADAKTAAAADVVTKAADVKSAAYDAKVAASKQEKGDGGAYVLVPWDASDIGDTISDLCSDNSLEWFESHEWNADRSGFITKVNVASPRVGRRRTDLRFEQGRNITNVIPVDESDEFAQVAYGIGAGEGAGAIRRETAIADGNLRRMVVNSAKDVTSATTLDARNRALLGTTMSTRQIGSIEVRGTLQVPIGSWRVGDDIRVDGVVPWIDPSKPQKLWHRITAWNLTSDNTATLTLKRSSAYTYGG